MPYSRPLVYSVPASHPSTASEHSSTKYIQTRIQSDTLSSLAEIRWGAFFGSSPYGLHGSFPGATVPENFMYLTRDLATSPLVVWHSRSMVGFFDSSIAHPLPDGNTELLAGLAFGQSQADLLGLTGTPGQVRTIFLASMDADDLEISEVSLPPVGPGPSVAAAGVGRSFYLAHDDHVMYLSVDNPDASVSVNIGSPVNALQIAATRLFPPTSGCSDFADILLLLDDQVMVFSCFHGQSAGRASSAWPVGAPSAGARLLVAPVAAMHDSTTPFYLVLPGAASSRDRLWMAVADGEDLSWRRVVLPPSISDLGDLQLVRLRTTDTGPGRWTLLSKNTALFGSQDFACESDDSVQCDGPSSSSGSVTGWACVAGRARSASVSPGRLCAGCADGWYLSRQADEVPFSQPSHACTQCPFANCRTCVPNDCYVCNQGFLLERSGSNGSTICVATCSAGYTQVADTCQPVGQSPPALAPSTAELEILPSLNPTDRVTCAKQTWLAIDETSGRLKVPAPGLATTGSGMLLFTKEKKIYFMLAEDIGQELKPSLREVDGLESVPSADVVDFAEAGPFVHNNRLLYLLVFCLDNRDTYSSWLSCEGPDSCIATATSPVKANIAGCLGAERLDGELILLRRNNWLLTLISPIPSTQSVGFVLLSGSTGMVSLPGPVLPGLSVPTLDRWLFSASSDGHAMAARRELILAADSRRQMLAGQFLSGSSDADGAFVPVAMHRNAYTMEEVVFCKLLGTEWVVLHPPGNMLPAGRSLDLPTRRLVLGVLPKMLEIPPSQHVNVLFQGILLPDAGTEYPSALILLTGTFLGVSLYHCPQGEFRTCNLQPAVFMPLPESLRVLTQSRTWTSVIVRSPGTSGSMPEMPLLQGYNLRFLSSSPTVGAVVFSLVLACPEGTWPNAEDHVCQACAADCATCVSAVGCATCRTDSYLGADQSCHACHISCARCEDAGSCVACRPGLVFLGTDVQVPSLCGGACLPGQYIGAGRCAECDASCELCAGSAAACQVCADGFRWASRPAPGATGTCVPCASGCASCTADKCLACEAGLFLASDGTCVSTCPAGAWPNGESCQPCDISCATCTGGGGADQCTGCGVGLDFVESAPGVGACVSGCDEGQYRDPDGLTCLPCDAACQYRDPDGLTCLPCDAACAACNGPSDQDCWQCRNGILQDGDCVQSCAGSHVALAGRCVSCHASCAECSGVRSTECLPACPGDLLPLPAGQSPMRCVPACPVGYGALSGGCTACAAHCAACPEASSACAQCERGWLLAGSQCVASCPGDTFLLGSICAPCHGSCGTCSGPDDNHCVTCPVGTFLQMDNRCQGSCAEGTFRSGDTCLPCSEACASCSDAGSDKCTGCAAGRVLHQGTCLPTCPTGFFKQDGACHACDESCAACISSAICTACKGQDMLQPGGTCGPGCPGGWVSCASRGQCLACRENCTECLSFGDECQVLCMACDPGFFLSSGDCHEACPAGEFAAAGSAVCQSCGNTCETCSGSGDFCTGCHSGLLLPQEGKCVPACPAASAPRGGVCVSCLAGCEQCDTAPGHPGECTLTGDGSPVCPDIGTCDRCMAGLLLLNGGACVEACPAGYFADMDSQLGSCVRCHESCAESCTGPGVEGCKSPGRSGNSRIGLAIGLSVGLLLLLLLLILLAALWLFFARRRGTRPMKPANGGLHDEDATMMNTLLELALPGAILVSVDADFAPVAEQPMGAGAQASVFAARAIGAGISARLGCPETVAIKRMKADAMKPTHVAMFHNEIALMWSLRQHGNIVRLYGYSEAPPAIVMERFDTDLRTLLLSAVPLSQLELLHICREWATGLEAMHAHGVAHCDLKPANVFVSQGSSAAGSWQVALGDLGTSRNLSTVRSSALLDTMPQLNALSVRYASPEVIVAIRRKAPLDPELFFPADIYSAAIMLHECLSQATPWPSLGLQDIMLAVIGGTRPEVAALTVDAADLVQAAWQENPSRRPSAAVFRQRCAALFVVAGGLDTS
ncbi:serine/threonine protein kinase [Fonticula alba]|uniref:Serine/threonine protein kinase n=1 Tax=Fonticula alba TaxID=691883 RepID=A0A058Z2L2_FONAL|nr:serine/threonine protein kinase [Fonticula alba]KCV68376.1 serine/threonine protein kinase [Fonticula alba]|eukprot:XP_009497430.1 serine/threonine protein kinase [Fonticula alba]